MDNLFVSKNIYARKADNSAAFTEGTKIYAIDGSTAALSLMDGSIAIFTDRDELLVNGATGGILADVKKVKVMLGRGFGKAPLVSEYFERNGTSLEYQVYTAPQKQVTVVGNDGATGSLNLPSPLVPTGSDSLGYAAILEIRRTDALDNATRRWRTYQVTIPATIAAGTAQQQATYIITKLVTAINNESTPIVVAAALGGGGTENGISLTAYDYGYTFDVNTLGILSYSDILDSTTSNVAKDMILGCGRPYQVADIERAALTEKGYTDKMTPAQWNTWKELSAVTLTDGCGYEVLHFHKADLPSGLGELNKMISKKMNLKIAFEGTLAGSVPTGAWTISNSNNSKTILDTLLPVVFGGGAYAQATAFEPATDIV